jgi:ribonucleoside-diphosphate reductase alpha chain
MNKIYSQEEALKATTEYFNGDSLAADVWVKKYALRNENGELIEYTPNDMHRRLAREFARIEAKYPNPMSENEIYDLLKKTNDTDLGMGHIVPQGSPMSAIGNPYKLQSLSNCFVIESPSDSYGGILFADQEQAQIMKRRGGVGFDISTIRPKGLTTANAAGTTDGIGVFMERFSNTCREVAQGGRRGALMLTISIQHPEIETFINIKRDLKKVTGANISIRITDEFMKAVESDSEFTLQWPCEVQLSESKITKSVKAKDIWNQIVDSAWAAAEPGLLFWDNAKKMTPSDAYDSKGYGSKSTNPCVTGDTIINTNAGQKTVKSLADENAHFYVSSYDIQNNKIVMNEATAFKTKENAKIIELNTKSGKKIKLTPDHRVYTQRGWVEAGSLQKGDKILSTK